MMDYQCGHCNQMFEVEEAREVHALGHVVGSALMAVDTTLRGVNRNLNEIMRHLTGRPSLEEEERTFED